MTSKRRWKLFHHQNYQRQAVLHARCLCCCRGESCFSWSHTQRQSSGLLTLLIFTQTQRPHGKHIYCIVQSDDHSDKQQSHGQKALWSVDFPQKWAGVTMFKIQTNFKFHQRATRASLIKLIHSSDNFPCLIMSCRHIEHVTIPLKNENAYKVWHGLPKFAMVWHGLPKFTNHVKPWQTLANHGKPIKNFFLHVFFLFQRWRRWPT